MNVCPACGPANTLKNHPEMNPQPSVISRVIMRLSEIEHENYTMNAARKRGEEIAMDDDQACQATPALELERLIMDSRVPKNEHEWWAASEIKRLRAKISERECVGCYRRLPVERGMHIGNEYEEIRCTALPPAAPPRRPHVPPHTNYCANTLDAEADCNCKPKRADEELRHAIDDFCDGCRRGLPLEGGMHSGGEYEAFSCTNPRVSNPAPEPSDGLTEEALRNLELGAQRCGVPGCKCATEMPIDTMRALVAAARELAALKSRSIPTTDASDEVLREQLAALAHEQWSGWMLYMLGDCDRSDCPAMYDPRESPRPRIDHPLFRERWQRQMDAAYAALPEAEKESDRKEADRVLALVGSVIAASRADLRDKLEQRIAAAREECERALALDTRWSEFLPATATRLRRIATILEPPASGTNTKGS